MLTLFKILQKALNTASNKDLIKKNDEIDTISAKSEYTNIRYLPLSTKIWSDSVYYYNKYFYPLLINNSTKLYHLFRSYFNMLYYKLNSFYKRRRWNKLHYSAKKIYSSRPELEHTNSKVSIILHIFNKTNLSQMKDYIAMIYVISGKKVDSNNPLLYKQYYKNRIFHSLKSKYIAVKGWIALSFKVKITKTITVLNRYCNKYVSVRHNKHKIKKLTPCYNINSYNYQPNHYL